MGIVHFASQIAPSQVYHLVDRLIGREDAMIARHGCRSVILTDGVALVVEMTLRMSSGKAKSGITCGKLDSPRLADRRVEGIPFRGPSVPG